MICHKHKCIFVHIPKTAGSSISKGLLKSGFDWIADDLHHPLFVDINICMPISNQYSIISCIRNPWDRMVSLYEYGKMRHSMGGNQLDVKSNEQFQEWLQRILYEQDIKIHNHSRRDYWLGNCANWLMVNGRICFTSLIRFENLLNDYHKICDIYKIKNPVKLPHLLKSNRKPYIEYYNDQTRQIIEKHCALDIDIFGYKFGE